MSRGRFRPSGVRAVVGRPTPRSDEPSFRRRRGQPRCPRRPRAAGAGSRHALNRSDNPCQQPAGNAATAGLSAGRPASISPPPPRRQGASTSPSGLISDHAPGRRNSGHGQELGDGPPRSSAVSKQPACRAAATQPGRTARSAAALHSSGRRSSIRCGGVRCDRDSGRKPQLRCTQVERRRRQACSVRRPIAPPLRHPAGIRRGR